MIKVVTAVGISIFVGSILVGCMTSKSTVATPASTNSVGVVTPGTTTTVTTVNTNNLTIDAAVIQGVVATAVSVAVQKDPSVIPALQIAQASLGGVLNGSDASTPGQIMALLGKNGNATIQAEITPLVSVVSGLEQQLLAKYGQGVAGQITLAIAKSVYAGLSVGLSSAPATK